MALLVSVISLRKKAKGRDAMPGTRSERDCGTWMRIEEIMEYRQGFDTRDLMVAKALLGELGA
jgi:hypothetical protein